LDASIQAPYATQARRTSNLFLLRSFRSPWEIMREWQRGWEGAYQFLNHFQSIRHKCVLLRSTIRWIWIIRGNWSQEQVSDNIRICFCFCS
jgi:hypothetical protein